ncbi:MAG: helix-turn-helix transcriptional regulator [Gammaproteobacteria bacterium]|nr:helix-turn-helix transcriptional regulator [Gammaproteobacteria bacterium]
MSKDGRVRLDTAVLKSLRQQRGYSQEILAQACRKQGICLSIATIKRAESGRELLYRSVRELAKFYQLEVSQLIYRTDGEHTEIPRDRDHAMHTPDWQMASRADGAVANLRAHNADEAELIPM